MVNDFENSLNGRTLKKLANVFLCIRQYKSFKKRQAVGTSFLRMSDSEINAYFAGNGTYKAINPIISKVGDFTPFYIAIAICSVIFGFLLILNIVCCCSRYSDYWLDRHTGNRWIVSIWSSTPHKQPPLDFTELESNYQQVHYVHPYGDNSEENRGDVHKQIIPSSISQQPLTSSQEYLELHKRESDI